MLNDLILMLAGFAALVVSLNVASWFIIKSYKKKEKKKLES